MKISSAEYRQKCSEARKGDKNPMYGKHGDKHPMYGKHHSDGTKKKISEAHKGKYTGEKNPMYGKHHSEETKKKMSEAQKGTKNHSWKGGGTKIKINCKTCGKEKYVPVAQIKNGRGKFCSHRCYGIWNTKHMKKKDTGIERLLEDELIRREIPYTKQVPLLGVTLVDFLLPHDTVVYADGNYWHNLPMTKKRDNQQDFMLRFYGYKVFRFWEKDINRSARKCIDKVLRA